MAEPIRGLSLTQPYATLVAISAKRIETRSWGTRFRGRVAIHAAKGFPPYAQDLCFTEPFKSALRPVIGGAYGSVVGGDEEKLPRGAIVAVARLVACEHTGRGPARASWLLSLSGQEATFGDYSPDRFGWFLDDVQALTDPIPCRGSLGLWQIPDDVLAMIDEQLGVAR